MSKTIVLIDDDCDDIEIMTEAIATVDESIRCVAFADPVQGVCAILQRAIHPDYVFIDINMPDMRGDVCLKILRAVSRLDNVIIAIISTSMSQFNVSEFHAAGADFTLAKPVSMDGYYDMLEEIFLIGHTSV